MRAALPLLAQVVQDTSTPGSRDVLIATAGTVIVSVIGGAVAVLTSRNRNSQTTEPNAILPREVNEFWAAEIARKDARIEELERELDGERDVTVEWMQKAYGAGWRP